MDGQSVRLATQRFGNGPRRVLCLHGFPDDPGTFAPLMDGLLECGTTVITPYLRGYGPSSPSSKGQYRLRDLGQDVLHVLNAARWESAVIIGHDWGAMAAYMAAAMAPHRVRGIVSMAVPPPRHFLSGLKDGAQRRRSSYMAFFQLGRLAEHAFAKDDFAALEGLWHRWSPNLDLPPEHLAQVKGTFTYPHTVRAALSYYRQLLPWGPAGWLPWLQSYKLAMEAVNPRTLILHGKTDGCIGPELFDTIGENHMETQCHPDAGHFLHWEDPAWVLGHLQRFLRETHEPGAFHTKSSI